MTRPPGVRIGIDLGGSKIAAIAMDAGGVILVERRCPSPQGDYAATLGALVDIVADLETTIDATQIPVGVGMPGSIAPRSGLVQNANSTWLNGRPISAA